jgi:hypothetical protein
MVGRAVCDAARGSPVQTVRVAALYDIHPNRECTDISLGQVCGFAGADKRPVFVDCRDGGGVRHL